jgi:hypothetical protein
MAVERDRAGGLPVPDRHNGAAAESGLGLGLAPLPPPPDPGRPGARAARGDRPASGFAPPPDYAQPPGNARRQGYAEPAGYPQAPGFPQADGFPRAHDFPQAPEYVRERGHREPPAYPKPPGYAERPDHAREPGHREPPGYPEPRGFQPGQVRSAPLAPSPGRDRVVNEDDEPTSPLPVLLGHVPGATALPRPEPVLEPRGPFEPARPSRTVSVTGTVEPPPSSPPQAGAPPAPLPGDRQPPSRDTGLSASQPPPRGSASQRADPAEAKLEQIKDLYLTAEAIGEDALDKHFEQVSQRQRDLIREFFQRSGGPAGPA